MKLSTEDIAGDVGFEQLMSRALADTMPAVTVLVRSKAAHGEHPIP